MHQEHVLPDPLDAGAGDARKLLFLLVHVRAHAGADTAADGRADQDLVELPFAQHRGQHRPGCGADGRSLPGLSRWVVRGCCCGAGCCLAQPATNDAAQMTAVARDTYRERRMLDVLLDDMNSHLDGDELRLMPADAGMLRQGGT